MLTSAKSILVILSLAFTANSAAADGDPTRRAVRLEPLLLEAATGFSVKRYVVDAGVYYRWRIEADGLEEYMLLTCFARVGLIRWLLKTRKLNLSVYTLWSLTTKA
jgi:hypothetical protein